MEMPEDIRLLRVPIPNNPLGFTLVYVIVAADGHTMVDTGVSDEAAFDTLTSLFHEQGLDLQKVRQIVLSHMHPDHCGLADRIRKVSGAKLLAHHLEINAYRSGGPWAISLACHGVPDGLQESGRRANKLGKGFVPPMPDVALNGGEIIMAGNRGLEVIWTPGHARGHVCLYDRKNRVLFTGDHVLPVITPSISVFSASADDFNPLANFISSIEKLKSLEVDIVLPAHEHVFFDLQGRLKEIENHHEQRLKEMRSVAVGSWVTAFDVARSAKWAIGPFDLLDEYMKVLAVGETLAHLEFLCIRGTLDKKTENGIFYYGTGF